MNIRRSEDHGLPGYTKFREALGGKPAKNFNDLADTIRIGDRRRLARVYNNRVEDVHLFPAGIVEIPVPGSTFGYTFTGILTKQFRHFRQGDRFWYERESVFKLSQLNEIRKTSISRIICDNVDGVTIIQKNGFRPRSSTNRRANCQFLPFVDLLAFKEGNNLFL